MENNLNVDDLFIVAEAKITYHPNDKILNKISIKSSESTRDLMKKVYAKYDDINFRERFYVISLNRANYVTSIYPLSVGGINGTVADIRIAMTYLINELANAFILVHNHPSGSVKPSDADIRITNKFNETGNCMEIKLLDHIILTPGDEYYSFADEGRI